MDPKVTQVFCGIKNCNKRIEGVCYGISGTGPVCAACSDKIREVARDLPLAIQEFHALTLFAPCIQSHGVSVFQDWWPRDIRETQRAALKRITALRTLAAWLKGE